MKKFLIFIYISIFLSVGAQAGLLDFNTLEKARDAYRAGQYEKAAKLYDSLAQANEGQKGQKALFDAADAYYKAGKYEEALKRYEKVTLPKLQHAKWHNIGNCYAHLKKIDQGIEAYKRALKIKEDADTRYNLRLLEKMKKEQKKKRRQQKKQNKKNQKSQNQNKQNRNDQSKNQKQNQGQQGKNQKQNQKSNQNKQNKQAQNRKNQGQKSKDQNEKGQNRQQKKQGKMDQKGQEPKNRKPQAAPMKPQNVPISDMELRKWDKMLGQRPVNTLMLPLKTQKNRRSQDETKLW